jgi:hypothetical protein
MINWRFWRPRERFLILDVKPQRTGGLLLSIDKDKNIILEKTWIDFPAAKMSPRRISGILRKKTLIVSLDPTLSAVFAFPVELRRDQTNSLTPLNLIELENLLAQSISKVFNKHRAEAAQKLGLHELDAILVNAKVGNFKIDGHHVVNPIGFPGATVSAVLELSFTTRQIFENLKDFWNFDKEIFMTNLARSALLLLSRTQPPPVNFINASSDSTFCYSMRKAAWGNIVYEGKLDWLYNLVFRAVALSVGVSRDVVLGLYQYYLNNELSENFRRAFERILRPEADRFFKELKKSKLSGRVYLYSSVPLPFLASARYGRVIVDEFPLSQTLDKTGFRLDSSGWILPTREIFMRLAPFFEFYYDKSDSDINQRLRRRIHWLIQ